jgi:hypothetical protein
MRVVQRLGTEYSRVYLDVKEAAGNGGKKKKNLCKR